MSAIRKREPERVRQRLLEATAQLAAERGIQAVTVNAVAQAAGVTKGGLFHHFASKDELIQEVVAAQIDELDRLVDQSLEADSGFGCFTRAYVEGIFASRETSALAVALMVEPAYRDAWIRWTEERVSRHAATDSDVALKVVRLAADGIWLLDVWVTGQDDSERDEIKMRLLAATRRE